MLETKNLVKIYKPKKGVPVTALDGVTLKFPDKGMVFLLGKSGSGKSTLLNVLGGLDKYDGGEIIIKGVSSKAFKQKHFDSYRNTYVGFIFQEYNILDDFTVGANIALALELQGKKATDAEINRILNDVDLAGYGARRPNELSGGQKQRVAIARALVKNPKIIMADEPSGALDSATGKQVFDTLKRLSREKLVIVVSHDRDFATDYADRIIELADGKVISDTSVCNDGQEENAGVTFEGATAKVPFGYRLTEEDRIKINEYIEKLQSGAEIEFANIKKKRFAATKSEDILNEDKTPFKLIKSKLSLKHAFKIGGSGLKHKKFRLVMTIFLSCIAFILFGLVDTFSSYDHIKTCTNSLRDSSITYAAVDKEIKRGEGIDSFWTSHNASFTQKDIDSLIAETGIPFNGVYEIANGDYSRFDQNVGNNKTDEIDQYNLRAESFYGIVEITQKNLDDMDYSLVAGALPDGSGGQIAISAFVCETFIKRGYIYNEEKSNINTYSDMVGKKLRLGMTDYTVSGVVDTNFDLTRYSSLFEDPTKKETADEILDFVLLSEFRSAVSNDYTGMMMVGLGGVEKIRNAESRYLMQYDCEMCLSDSSFTTSIYPDRVTCLDNVDKNRIIWLNGERESLADNEIIISSYDAESFFSAVFYGVDGELEIDAERLSSYEFNFRFWKYIDGDDNMLEKSGLKIVGVINNHFVSEEAAMMDFYPVGAIFPDSLFNHISDSLYGEEIEYDIAIGAMPNTRSGIESLVSYCYTEKDGVRYALNNPVCFELDSLDEVIKILANVFVWVGVVFAVFASLLLSNFIATSISYKKQEIGILRAIGSRGNDVYRIFFAESFIIAMINFVISCVGTGLITFFVNMLVRNEVGILITFLNFGIRQVFVLFVISVAIAAIASFLPVKKIASKRPIDAIRGR